MRESILNLLRVQPTLEVMVGGITVYVFSVDNPFVDAIHRYGRYIDDLLVILAGDVSAVPVFVDYLNDKIVNLKFTFSSHSHTIALFDLELMGIPNEVIVFNICPSLWKMVLWNTFCVMAGKQC